MNACSHSEPTMREISLDYSALVLLLAPSVAHADLEHSVADAGRGVTPAEVRVEHPVSASTDRRIPSLDGLRAVSIGMVVFSHLAGTRGFPISTKVANILPLGELGVRVFFVISGFLITNLLLDEWNRRGTISLSRFYFRRTFRILPPYYVLVAAVGAASFLQLVQLAPADLAHAITYTSNYYAERSWWVGHTWSLAVEEQFYLLWPAVLLLAGRRRGFIVAAAVVLVSPFVRLAIWQLAPSSTGGIGHGFESVADSLAIGCLLAGLANWLMAQAWYRRILESPAFLLVPLIVLAASALHEHPRPYFFVSFTVMNVGAALCVHWAVTYHKGGVGRFLNAPPIAFIGVISYSIYLWQQLFLNRDSASVVGTFPLNIVLVAAAALASFYLIERPSLRTRHRLEGRLFRRRQIERGVVRPPQLAQG
jgi:peptidoglycan/LPS O-acetylase OafA/YrhL